MASVSDDEAKAWAASLSNDRLAFHLSLIAGDSRLFSEEKRRALLLEAAGRLSSPR